jgi:hypothetical protein
MNMKRDLSYYLNQISVEILCDMRADGLVASLDFATRNLYRNGFERISVARSLEPWRIALGKMGVLVDEMAVEVITVTDLVTDIHYHEEAYAVITILGPDEGVEEPEGSIFFFGDMHRSLRAVSGITLQVKPKVIHGFACPKGAKSLSFLSVQSRRIEEDFHVV